MREGILTMDIATTSGWAFQQSPSHKLVYSSFTISKYQYGEGEILLQFARNMSDLMKIHNPKYLYIEAPFLRNFNKGKGKKGVTQNMNVAKTLLRFTGLANMYGASFGLSSDHIKEINNQDIKQFMTGIRTASKDMMINACINKGYSPRCDNEADAIGLMHLAYSKIYGEELEFIK